jgi:hypothetical protein
MLGKIFSDGVPIFLTDKEPFKVCICSKNKADTAIEGYFKHTNDRALKPSDLE